MSTIKFLQQPKKVALVTLGVLLGVMVLFNLALTIELMRKDKGVLQLGLIILSAVDNLYKPVVVEPLSGKVYIPEAKLVLPPTQSLNLVYQFSPKSSDTSQEILLGSKADMGPHEADVLSGATAPDVLAATAKLQACVRGVLISFQPVDRHLTEAGTKQLANGSTAYFYTEPQCPNNELLTYAKQINSY